MSKALKSNSSKTVLSLPLSCALSPAHKNQKNFLGSPRKNNLDSFSINLTASIPANKATLSISDIKQSIQVAHAQTPYLLSNKKLDNLPNLSGYAISSPRGVENPYWQPIGKRFNSSKKPMLQIDLDKLEMEEFPQAPKTLDYTRSVSSQTPLQSPKIKTLSSINEALLGVSTLCSARSPIAKSKRIAFPQEAYDDRGGLKPVFLLPGWNSPRNTSNLNTNRQSCSKEVLLNTTILNRLVSFFDCSDLINIKSIFYEYRQEKRYRNLFKRKLVDRLLHNLNENEQSSFWDALLNFRKLKEIHPLAFTLNFLKKCKYTQDINKDLDRTFPEYEKYSTIEGKEALLKVLVAISNTVKDLGYIQGLNSISGVFLFYVDEEKSYWLTLYMMEKLKVKNILREDFNTVHVLNYQLKTFLENYIPEIASFLHEGSVDVACYTTSWFITLFSYFLTLPNIVKTWNFLFIKGNAFLIQLSLAVFARYKDTLLSMNADDLGSFFKYDLREISAQDDLLFQEALKFRVSNRLMLELEEYYAKGKPHLKLVKDSKNKLQWVNSLDTASSVKLKEKPKFQIDLNHNKDSLRPSVSDSRSVTSPRSAMDRGKELVQTIVHTITIDLPGAIKDIFIKSPSKSNIDIVEPKLNIEPLQASDPNYFTKPRIEFRASLADLLSQKDKDIISPKRFQTLKTPSSKETRFTSLTIDTENNELNHMISDRIRVPGLCKGLKSKSQNKENDSLASCRNDKSKVNPEKTTKQKESLKMKFSNKIGESLNEYGMKNKQIQEKVNKQIQIKGLSGCNYK